MNSARHPNYLFLLLLAAGLTAWPVLRAQNKPTDPATPPAAAATTPVATPAPATPGAPAVAPAAASEQPPAPADPAAVEPAKTEGSDEPAAAGEAEATVAPADAATATPVAPAKAEEKSSPGHRRHRVVAGNSNERITFFGNSTLPAGEKADAVVSIAGSSTSAGDVGDAVVSIIGGSRVTGGNVGDAVVSVLGNTYVNAHVSGQVVTVLGNVELGPKAVVDGELVCIGGQVTKDPAAVVKGGTQNIGIAGHYFNFDGLTAWFTQCLLYARPLAFGPHLGWAWCIALGFLAFYALIALVAPAGVNKCVDTLEQHPGSSLLAALLTLLLTPVAYILLLLTLAIAIGFVLIPLFSTGLFFASVFGKIVMLAWLGRRVTKLLGDGPFAHPAIGVLIGGAIMLLLYTIPVLGFIVYKLTGILGLGVVVYTLIRQYKASRPVKPKPVAPVVPAAPVPPFAPMASDASVASAVALVAPLSPEGGSAVPPVIPVNAVVPPPVPPANLPPVISAATLPRAGFWIRCGASLLDVVMVGIAFGMLQKVSHGFADIFPFWFTVYCVVMWATKGTTIGGVICGLKVVRLDDRPIDWGVAVVRSIGAFLSLAVAGIGFIWVAFDDDKQSWHDKIAGTTIVIVPKGTALL